MLDISIRRHPVLSNNPADLWGHTLERDHRLRALVQLWNSRLHGHILLFFIRPDIFADRRCAFFLIGIPFKRRDRKSPPPVVLSIASSRRERVRDHVTVTFAGSSFETAGRFLMMTRTPSHGPPSVEAGDRRVVQGRCRHFRERARDFAAGKKLSGHVGLVLLIQLAARQFTPTC